MAIKLDGPIPGQSLTRELGNAPWEQPPLYAHPQQALASHLEKLNKGSHIEDLLFLVGEGFPISTFVDSLLTKAVMEGYHTVDVSQLIAPVLHQYIKELAQSANIKYTEFDGPTPEEQEEEKYKKRLQIKLGNNLPVSKPPINAAEPFTPPAAVNPEPSGPPPVESLGAGQGYVQKRPQGGM